MRPRRDPHLTARARNLRSDMEPAELALWVELRGKQLGTRFRRQQPLFGFVVDFVSMRHRLVVELDGSQHEDSEDDRRRDAILRRRGFRVFRFWNEDLIQGRRWVVEEIRRGLVDPGYESRRE